MQANRLGEQIFAPSLGADHNSVLHTVPSLKDASSTDCCAGPTARFGPSSLPPLNEDTYIDKDTLSRLFLVSSKVAQEVRVRGTGVGLLSCYGYDQLSRSLTKHLPLVQLKLFRKFVAALARQWIAAGAEVVLFLVSLLALLLRAGHSLLSVLHTAKHADTSCCG
jgi:hypothetical protein